MPCANLHRNPQVNTDTVTSVHDRTPGSGTDLRKAPVHSLRDRGVTNRSSGAPQDTDRPTVPMWYAQAGRQKKECRTPCDPRMARTGARRDRRASGIRIPVSMRQIRQMAITERRGGVRAITDWPVHILVSPLWGTAPPIAHSSESIRQTVSSASSRPQGRPWINTVELLRSTFLAGRRPSPAPRVGGALCPTDAPEDQRLQPPVRSRASHSGTPHPGSVHEDHAALRQRDELLSELEAVRHLRVSLEQMERVAGVTSALLWLLGQQRAPITRNDVSVCPLMVTLQLRAADSIASDLGPAQDFARGVQDALTWAMHQQPASRYQSLHGGGPSSGLLPGPSS